MNFPSPTKAYHRKAQAICDPTNPSNSASGKVVLITGGGRGIGLHIAKAFGQAGAAHIVLTGRSQETLDGAKKDLEASYPNTKVHVFAVDVTDVEGLDRTFAAVESAAGKVDVCVANAGYLPDMQPALAQAVDEFWRGFEVNTKGTFLVARAFARHAARGAVFVSLNTGGAHLGYFGPMAAYASSKAATAKFVEYFQAENPGLRAYSLAPGMIKTDMSMKAGLPDEMMDDASLPATFCVWLASPAAEFLKGRFVWAHWDAEELKQREQEILSNKDLFTISLGGWPFSS